MEMTENNFVTMLEESIKPLHTGETVTGIVYAITDNEIYLDLGAKFTGVIVKEQITDDASAKLPEMFKVGDEVNVISGLFEGYDGVVQSISEDLKTVTVLVKRGRRDMPVEIDADMLKIK